MPQQADDNDDHIENGKTVHAMQYRHHLHISRCNLLPFSYAEMYAGAYAEAPIKLGSQMISLITVA
jgi:hypothetical protein